MDVYIESLLEGAARSRGTAVVIDVFRAFTTAAVALSRGARHILLTAEPQEALALREAGAADLCMGEVGGVRPPGFDFGNSPYELSHADVHGKVLAQSTRAGTVGVCAIAGDRPIYAASLVVARATASRILERRPGEVTLVAMGRTGQVRADEDEVCAMYVRNLLEGRDTPHDAVRSMIRASAESAQYDDPALPHFHPGDREIALQIDRFDFAIAVSRESGLLVARMDPPTAAAP